MKQTILSFSSLTTLLLLLMTRQHPQLLAPPPPLPLHPHAPLVLRPLLLAVLGPGLRLQLKPLPGELTRSEADPVPDHRLLLPHRVPAHEPDGQPQPRLVTGVGPAAVYRPPAMKTGLPGRHLTQNF